MGLARRGESEKDLGARLGGRLRVGTLRESEKNIVGRLRPGTVKRVCNGSRCWFGVGPQGESERI